MEEPPAMDGARSACSLSLIIPAYNEGPGIAQATVEADNALRQLGVSYEILVIDDGSRDETAAEVHLVSQYRQAVRLLQHRDNRGYGAALRTGFEAARGERVAFTDADGQFDLADLERLVALSNHTPIVIGY